MPTTGDKIIQEMEFRYSSVGDEKAQARVEALIRAYENLRRAASTILSPKAGDDAKNRARSALASANEQIRVEKARLTAQEAIENVQLRAALANMAMIQRQSDAEVDRINRQRTFAKQTEKEIAREREQNYRGLTQQLKQSQDASVKRAASNMSLIQKESDAEVARINRQRAFAKQTEKEIAADRQRNYQNLTRQLTVAEQLANRPDIAGQRTQLAKERFTGEANRKIFASLSPAETFSYYMNRFGNVFRRVTDALLSFLIINTVSNAIRGFLSTIIESNKQLELLDARLGGLTGVSGSLSELRATIIDLTVRTPFILKDFLDASVTITAFGINARKQLLPIANWAAAIGRDLPDVALAFSKIVTGSPRAALLLSTRGISKAEFDAEKARVIDSVQALNNIIERRFGDMALRVSKTFAGLLSNIKDVWFLISAAIGKDVFQAIRTDLQAIYDVFIKTAQGGSFLGTIITGGLSKALWGLYTIIKISVIPILSALAIVWGSSIYRFFKGAIDTVNNFKVGLGTLIGKAQGAIMVLITAVTAFKLYEVAIKRVNAAMSEYRKGGEAGSQILIDRIEELRDSLRNVNGPASFMRDIFEKLPRFAQDAALWISKLTPGTTGQQFLELIVNNRLADALDKVAKKNQELKNSMEALRKAMEELGDIKEAFDFKEMLSGLEGATEAFAELMGRIPAMKKRMAAEFAKAASTGSVADTKGVRAQWENILRLEEFGALFGLAREEATKRAREEFRKEMDNILVYVSKRTGDPIKELRERFEASFFKKEKTKGSVVELKDYTTELNAEVDKYIAFLRGAGREEAQIVKLNSEAVGLTNDWLKLASKSNLTIKEKNEMHALEVKYYANLNKEQELLLRVAEKRYNLAARNFELEQNLITKQIENRRGELEFSYQRTGDIQEYRNHLARVQEGLEDQLDNVRFQIEYHKKLQASRTDDLTLWLNIQSKILGLSQEEADIAAQILSIRKDIYSLPSPTFFIALQKQAAQLKIELLDFSDILASTVLSGIREFSTGVISSLLFGTGKTDNSEKIADLRFQLEDLYRQQRRESNVWRDIVRREDESSEQYLARLRMAQEEYQKRTQIYEYQTKELEIMNEINKLEAERNSLISERLQQLGQKVFDVLLNQIVGRAISALLPGSNATSSGGGNPTPGQSGFLQPSVSPGVTIQFNGPVYGTRDFDMAIDNAMARIESKRGR